MRLTKLLKIDNIKPLIKTFIKPLIVSSFIFASLLFSVSNMSFAQVGTANHANTKNSNPSTDVMILQIVDHPALNKTREGIEQILAEQGVSFHYESAQGNPALASQIAQNFVGKKPKILIGIGTAAAQALVAESRSLDIPVVFSSVTDPLAAKLVQNLKQPEGNVTGVSNYVEVSKTLSLIKGFLPNLKNLGVIHNPGEVNSMVVVRETEKQGKLDGISVITSVANNTAEVVTATRDLINKVDAIFINNDNTALSAFEAITKTANKFKKPVFVSDIDLISQGAYAAMGPDQFVLGQQTAKMVMKILNGQNISTLPIEFPSKIEVIVNREVEKLLNLNIPETMKSKITGYN